MVRNHGTGVSVSGWTGIDPSCGYCMCACDIKVALFLEITIQAASAVKA